MTGFTDDTNRQGLKTKEGLLAEDVPPISKEGVNPQGFVSPNRIAPLALHAHLGQDGNAKNSLTLIYSNSLGAN